MSLIELKRHMMQVKVATLASLCAVFQSNSDQVRCLLSHLMQKGCIRQGKKPACGSTCFQCSSATMEWYEWIETGVARVSC